MTAEGSSPGGAGPPASPPPRYALVVGRFYEELAERLVGGAREALTDAGVEDVHVFDVPGAFELPLGASYAAGSGRYEGVVCLGAVIRGETSHYDHVCAEAARGIQDVQLRTGVPCGFGVLTVETMDQALARLGEKRHQGRDAAQAVLRMAALRAELAAETASRPSTPTLDEGGRIQGR